MYHRICHEPYDPWAICVSPNAFADQMEVLATTRAAVDLGELAAGDAYSCRGDKVAVTFDDGYADNLTAALPILERFGIPATVFVVGNAVGRDREFWWDALQRAVLGEHNLPEELTFEFGPGPRTFTLLDGSIATAARPGWFADQAAPRTQRESLFRALWDAIVVLDPDDQDAAADHLLRWAGQPVAPPRSRLPVTADQFAELAAHPLVTVGCHTLDHVSLTDLSPREQQHQITAGRTAIEELAEHPVDRLSYPYGRFDVDSLAAVDNAHIAMACTSVPWPSITREDPRAVPRLQATEMDGDQFRRWLRDHGLLRHRGRTHRSR